MAKFTAGLSGIDFTKFDIQDLGTGNATVQTDKDYKLEVDTTDFNEFFGTGFKYAGLDLIGGTLNEIVAVDVTPVYDVSGFSMAVTTAEKFLAKNDPDGFLAALFVGADSIAGSTVADTLLGFNGNDTIDGLGGSDSLNGGAGNDSLVSGAGNDSMDGAAGNDTYDVDSTTDVASELVGGAAGGADTVRSSAATYTLGGNIENLVLTGTAAIDGTGNSLANVLTGNSGDNELSDDVGKDKLVGGDGNDTLSGGADNDTLDGGIGNDSLVGGTGDDSMAGGAGDDVYVVDSAKDKVTESLANDKGGGQDTVESSVSFTLGNNLDDLMLLPSTGRIDGTGNALDNALTGNDKDNKLSGLAGADTIVGGDGNDTLDGGIGTDSMAGGKGDDTYVLDVAVGNDTVTEAAGGGKDTVQAAFSIDLGNIAFKNIENATLLGMAALSAKGTDADGNFLTGNGGANTLEGGGGNDTLEGGKGNDGLKGGTGDDVYGIDSAKDTVEEGVGDANDTLRSSITVNLASYPNIENVELVGTGAINATGTDGVNNKLTGNAGANKLDGLGGDDTMDGRLGNDTYFVDSSNDKVSEDTLTGGGTDTVFSTANFTLNDNIENLTLLGAALTGTGNDGSNTITGNDLANTLDGKGGIDKLIGGKGDDIYIVDNAKDVVTESTAGPLGGKDTVNSSDSFILGMNVENLILTGNKNSSGTGNALDNAITGDGTSNTLFGLAGADTLDGGAGNDTLDGGTGNDTLTGGTGNDTYVLDNKNDTFHEDAGDSGDTVAAPFNIDLNDPIYDNIESATLLGTAALTAVGDGGNNILTGNSGANTLMGGIGSDTLDGKGGVDSLDGDKGNDVYYADNAGEKIFDTGGDAKDEVRASVTFTLGALVTIENAMLLGIAALNLSGNAIDNVLTGNDGANKIDGVDGNDSVAGAGGNDTLTGGTGSDTLAGGKGDDVYVVDGSETILENDKEGTADTVQSALTYSIAAFANVENLTLTGSLAINGTGNSANNIITGNSNQNTLDGSAGADTMAGGLGNDTYVVDDAKDVINEAAKGGIDTVLSSLADYTLPANVENLTLTGSGDLHGKGNALGNIITGNDGKNALDGDAGNDTLAGGLGADTLTGGAGADTYVYATGDVQDVVHTGESGGKGADHVSITGAFDWDVQRDVNDLLIQAAPDETAANADFDPTQAIRIVDQYAGAGIAFFQGDFGKDNNLFYGDNPNLTTVFTPSGLNGKDQGHNAEVVEGTAGNDTVNGGGGQTDFLYGNDGDDHVNSQSANDEFAFLSGGKGDDTLTGAAGTDAFRGDEGDDLIDGGAGFDRVSYRLATAGVIVDLTTQGLGRAQTIGADQGKDTLISIEAATGSKFNDTLTGDTNANNLFGIDGNDSLSGGGGADFLEGGAGNDTLSGKSLGDFVEASYEDAKVGAIVNLTNAVQAGVAALTAQDGLGGIDTLINIAGVLGSDFGDKFFGGDANEFFEPGGGDDTIDGGAGFDDVDYFSSSDGVVASLIDQGKAHLISASQGSDLFINIEGLDGSAFNDTLVGDFSDNFLQGRAGADSLYGFDGNDRLRGGAGNDTLDGANGFDVADYAFAISEVHVDLYKQFQLQVISKDEGSDDLRNIEDLRGSAFNDTLIGNSGDNILTGSDGNDSLVGGGGFDSLAGGAGNDILNGGDSFDFANYSDAAASGGVTGVRVDLSKHGVAQVISTTEGSDVLIAIEAASGSQFNDTLIGDSAFNKLTGHDGDDLLQGGANQDFLVGGKGNDTLDGGAFGEFNEASFEDAPAGAIVNLTNTTQLTVLAGTAHDGFGTVDTLIGIQGVFGSESNDTIFGGSSSEFFEGMGGNDSIVGGAGFGFDALEYFSSADGVTANLSNQGVAQFISATQGTDTFTQIEDLYGSSFNDSLTGDINANYLFAREGNDTLVSVSGADTLVGGAGNDRLVVADNSFGIADGDYLNNVPFGTDRLVISGANVNISQADVFNKLYNIEEVDLTGIGKNSIALSALDVLQTSDTSQMRILGDSGDQVTSTGQGWVNGGIQNFSGQDYTVYTTTVHVPQGTFQATLFVDTDITATIS
jgi:Ca2+-binding RTX toxin-like protein